MTPATGVLPGKDPCVFLDSIYLAQVLNRGKKIGSRMRPNGPKWSFQISCIHVVQRRPRRDGCCLLHRFLFAKKETRRLNLAVGQITGSGL